MTGYPAPVGVPHSYPTPVARLVDHILRCLLAACSLVSPTHAPNPPLTRPSHPESIHTAPPLPMSVACPQALTHELSHTRPLTPLKLALIHGASVRLSPARIAHALAHAHALACTKEARTMEACTRWCFVLAIGRLFGCLGCLGRLFVWLVV